MFPYTTEDLVVAERLLDAGCRVLMPWGAPIGSGRGLNNVFGLRSMRAHFPDVPLVVDAGIGAPSHAAAAMELGYDAVLLNTAVAKRGRSRRDGACLRAGGRGRARGFPRHADGAARHGRAVDAGDRKGVYVMREFTSLDRFYPIVDNADWVMRIVGAGAKLIQLRMKDLSDADVARDIQRAKALCEAVGAQLIVNDYWRAAIEAECDYVHLGQGDLDTADMKAIRKAGIKVGLSTHDHAELDRAMSFDPDYVALGPIYPTLLKQMPWAPQGIENLAEWKQRIGDMPLVAIGGLTPERARLVLQAGADSACVVTDILRNPDPEARTREWIAATMDWREK